MNNPLILHIAVPVPFRKTFDYLPSSASIDNINSLQPGIRIKIPFGRTEKIGVLVKTSFHTDFQLNKLKPIIAYLDEKSNFDAQHFSWLLWISQYYHHPIGMTLSTALPNLLRKDKPIKFHQDIRWQLSKLGEDADAETLNRAAKQKNLLVFLKNHQQALSTVFLNEQYINWRPAMIALEKKNLVQKQSIDIQSPAPIEIYPSNKQANSEQQKAIDAISQSKEQFNVFLLDGVTGSGKTEVYLNSIIGIIKNQQQVLILIPEIGLTPQLLQRFKSRFGEGVATLHSGMNDTERLNVWQQTKNNQIRILIGTRSAIFTPMPHLGMIIIDEEHDVSFKQQEGLRYSARDIALTRAQRLNIPVVLGSATPSFESLLNVKKGSFKSLLLKKRAGGAQPPKIVTLNIKGQHLTENFSKPLIDAMAKHLGREEQVMIFLNRRGFAPTIICQECGWVGMCNRCDHPMTIHAKKQRIICHHCGADHRVPKQCPECSCIDLRPRGYGTERTELVLQELFPEIEIIRIDRDTTARKNAMNKLLNRVSDTRAQILLGTQMLAKGHDFPNVTLVGILDADQGLFGVDLRAGERMAQLITQVAGRAGRGKKVGRVIIQTQHPDHPLFTTLIEHDYRTYSENALLEREMALLPPYTHAVLLRAEANYQQNNIQFLMDVKNALREFKHIENLEILGPAPSAMERRAGKYRTQLLIIGKDRKSLHRILNQLLQYIESCKTVKHVKWHLDVDPQDMS